MQALVHSIGNRGEFYVIRKGEGALLLWKDGPKVCQKMSAGSVHYIPGHDAHRFANTGDEPLVFIACWPSDAGCDYSTIEKSRFRWRLLKRDDGLAPVPQE
jgi:glucose-6-phosphate isomerase